MLLYGSVLPPLLYCYYYTSCISVHFMPIPTDLSLLLYAVIFLIRQKSKSYQQKYTYAAVYIYLYSFFSIFFISPCGFKLLSFHLSLKDTLSFLQSVCSSDECPWFCLFRNVLISPSFLKNSFARYRMFH